MHHGKEKGGEKREEWLCQGRSRAAFRSCRAHALALELTGLSVQR